jgi:peptidoglycan/xylan/chitin deacetylase (PgdA/CDA1 family)
VWGALPFDGTLRSLPLSWPFVFALNRRRLRMLAGRSGVDHVVRAAPHREERVLALTFDDGPSSANTERLLELLERHDARATFFMVGERVLQAPALARAVVAAGHEVGNHSYSHAHPGALGLEELSLEFDRAADVIERAAGVRPSLVRPPYGKRAEDLDGKVVLWSIDSGDTAGFGADRVAGEIVDHARSGDIVLLHDGGDWRPVTIAAVERVLETLSARGFSFVTVSELLSTSA